MTTLTNPAEKYAVLSGEARWAYCTFCAHTTIPVHSQVRNTDITA